MFRKAQYWGRCCSLLHTRSWSRCGHNNYEYTKIRDDSKILGKVNSNDDIEKLQEHMEYIFGWAEENHMRCYWDKFQLLRVGPNVELQENTYLFTPNFEDIIEEKIA